MPRYDDRSVLSKKPEQIRRRMRRSSQHLHGDLEQYVEVTAYRPVQEWDLEELARGRCRAKDGTFRGIKPSWITPAVAQEARKRLMDHTFGKMAGHVDAAVTVIRQLMESRAVDEYGKPIVDARTRLAAATFIIDHVVGKPTARVDVTSDDIVRQFIAGALVLDDGQPAHPVVDGQFTEDEETDDDEA